MENQTELSEIELSQESNVNTQDTQETLNSEPLSAIPEPETDDLVYRWEEPKPEPWESAPEGLVYYEKIYEDGHLGSFTKSAELAYKFGWFENSIPEEDLEVSDINGWTYLKSQCPHKTQEMILSETRLQKLNELKQKSIQALDTAYVLSSLGFKADANTTAVRDLEGLVIIGADTVMFCDFDNEFHPLNKEQVLTLQREVLLNGQNLYAQKWAFRKQINEAETIEAINAVEIHFDMLSFQE